jgi:ABC-type branched-subunit amino acid transport system ATPase component
MLLRTTNLSINFGNLWAVNDINFSIDNGEIVGLIGPNGSGKTTFFNLLSGIYRPTRGAVFLQNDNITNLYPHQIRERGIARTFQSSKLLWELSVIDNVLSGLYTKQKTTWLDAVLRPKKSNLELKLGIEKCLDLISYFNVDLIARRFEKAKNIPHIDRRRIEICRALVSDPAVLLLDEPSAGLNREETMSMMDDISRIKEKRQNVSIVIIEHDMSVISRVSGRVVALNYGRKIAEGTYFEVANNEEVRKAYLGGERAC